MAANATHKVSTDNRLGLASPMRGALLEATRIVEQTAMLCSLARGTTSAGKSVWTVAAQQMTGGLKHLREANEAQIVLWHDPTVAGDWESTIFAFNGSDFAQTAKGAHNSPNVLHVAIAPIDGIKALTEGVDGGSVSALAAGLSTGGKDAFAPHPNGIGPDALDPKRDTRYFTLVFGKEVWNALGKDDQAELSQFQVTEGTTFSEWAESAQFVQMIDKIVDNLGHTNLPTIGTVAPASIKNLKKSLESRSRMRAFSGSTIAAALCSLFPQHGVPVFIGSMTHAQAVIVSIAVQALGGKLIAFSDATVYSNLAEHAKYPDIIKVKRPEDEAFEFKFANGQSLDENHFVRTNECFVALSGISEHCLLRGVRFRNLQDAELHTLAINGKSKTVRWLRHAVQPQLDHLYDERGNIVVATDRLSHVWHEFWITPANKRKLPKCLVTESATKELKPMKDVHL